MISEAIRNGARAGPHALDLGDAQHPVNAGGGGGGRVRDWRGESGGFRGWGGRVMPGAVSSHRDSSARTTASAVEPSFANSVSRSEVAPCRPFERAVWSRMATVIASYAVIR